MSTELTKQGAEQRKPNNLAEIMQMVSVAPPESQPAMLHSLLDFQERLEGRDSKKAYNIAWAEMAPELPYVAENGLNTFTGNRYARWDDIHRACMPVLRKFGFSVSFDSRKDGADVLFCIVVIRHIGGHEERPEFPFPWREPSKGRSAGDEVSAALSKAQRHAFRKAFNILSLGEEEMLYASPLITGDEAQTITDILLEIENREVGSTNRFNKWIKSEFNVDNVSQIHQGKNLDAVRKRLEEKQIALGMKR